jgi:hypothetical protein
LTVQDTISEAGLPEVVAPQNKAERELLAITPSREIQPIAPKTLDEAFRYAQMVVRAGLAPDSYDTNGAADPQKVVIGILAGSELGVPPMQALKGIAIINKRACIWGDLAVALIQRQNVVANTEQTYTGDEGTDEYTAHYTIWRKGQDNPYEGHFSVKDAKRAGLWMNARKQPWVNYPNIMLMRRARAFALRDGFADCLAGLAIAEEAQDLPTEPKVLEAGVLDDTVEPMPTQPTPEAKPEAAE